MQRSEIKPNQLVLPPVSLWGVQWMLLMAGNYELGLYNGMTVAWGSLGVMWGRPFAQIVVRPTRYTLEFLKTHDTFTLSAFDDSYEAALERMGSVSGREHDKLNETGLTAVASRLVGAPSIKEAELTIECRTIYSDRINPDKIRVEDIHSLYPEKDYHVIFFGEIVAASGVEKYRAK
jgi:flavin reductase (DIM6/NTAB) family NADH-FMN oxidoreductase RutF